MIRFDRPDLDALLSSSTCSSLSPVNLDVMIASAMDDALVDARAGLDLPDVTEERDDAVEELEGVRRKYGDLLEAVARARLSILVILDGRGVDVDADPAAALAMIKGATEGILAALCAGARIDLEAEEARLSRPAATKSHKRR